MNRNALLIILLLIFLVVSYFLLTPGERRISPTGLLGSDQQEQRQEGGEAEVEQTDKNQVTVNMTNDQFEPARLQIRPGTTVNWVNQDPYLHTVTGFGVDQEVPRGESFQYTFNDSGEFSYRCTIHAGMTGEIVVSSQ